MPWAAAWRKPCTPLPTCPVSTVPPWTDSPCAPVMSSARRKVPPPCWNAWATAPWVPCRTSASSPASARASSRAACCPRARIAWSWWNIPARPAATWWSSPAPRPPVTTWSCVTRTPPPVTASSPRAANCARRRSVCWPPSDKRTWPYAVRPGWPSSPPVTRWCPSGASPAPARYGTSIPTALPPFAAVPVPSRRWPVWCATTPRPCAARCWPRWTRPMWWWSPAVPPPVCATIPWTSSPPCPAASC